MTSRICHHQVYIPPREVLWIPPEEGHTKLNFDGGFFQEKSSGISAGIFRDHRGAPVISYAYAKPEWTGTTPYDAEARALCLGLTFARSRGFTNKLWVEGDAKFLIDVVEGRRKNAWYGEDVLDEIRKKLDEFSERPRVTFVHREGNKAADALVKHVHERHLSAVGWEWDRDQGDVLPVRVVKVTDRERRGYPYVRQASSYINGPMREIGNIYVV